MRIIFNDLFLDASHGFIQNFSPVQRISTNQSAQWIKFMKEERVESSKRALTLPDTELAPKLK